MSCSDLHPSLNAYIDGALTERESLQIEVHLKTCEACRREVEGLRSLTSSLAELRDETASPTLHESVIRALQSARTQPRKGLAGVKGYGWRWALGFSAAAGIVLLLLLFWRGRSSADLALRQVEDAVAKTTSLHMVCTWYRPENRQQTFTQREIWIAGGRTRWTEAGGTSALISEQGVRIVHSGSGQIPAEAARLTRGVSLEAMLAGIVRIRGARISAQRDLHWRGSSFDAVVVNDTAKDGAPIRTIFMIDPRTSLPVHGEQEKQSGGRWRTEGLIRFDFTAIQPPL